MYCNAGDKATVNYTSKSGVKSKFITYNTPIDVECINQERTGRYIYTINDFGYTTNCESSGQRFTDTVIADSYQVSPTTNDGQYSNCPWYELSFYIGENKISSLKKTSRYSVSQTPNPNYNPGGKQLKVKNSQGTEIFKADVKDCNYTVACGDNCPEGFCKCPKNSYPGYCCLSCASTANAILNLASKVGRCCG